MDNSLTRWKRRFFKKIPYSRNSKSSVWNTNFIPDKVYQTFFCFTLSLHWWYSIPSLVWFGQLLDPMKKIFLKLSKFRNSRNSQNSAWKITFFLGQLYQQLLALHCHYIGDTPNRVWFDLDNSLTRWKKPIFKIPFSRNSQNSVRRPIFFPRQALPIFFCFTLSLHWWYSIPSLVWFGQLLDPMKRNFFKILKNSQFAKFAKFRIKNHFFPRHSIPTTFRFPLSLHCWYSITSLVWFGQLLDPLKKNLKFSKIRNSRNSHYSVWKPKFFLARSTKNFLIYTLITLVILHTAFGLIWTTP